MTFPVTVLPEQAIEMPSDHWPGVYVPVESQRLNC